MEPSRQFSDRHPDDWAYGAAERGRWRKVIQPTPEGWGGDFRELPEGIYAVPTEHMRVTDPGRVRKTQGSALEKKIAAEGIKRPVHIAAQSSALVDGNHRVNAAKNLGLETVPTLVTHMTPDRMRRWYGK